MLIISSVSYLVLYILLAAETKKAKKPLLVPIIDVVTRWNSTFDMLMRFQHLNTELYAALVTLEVCKLC